MTAKSSLGSASTGFLSSWKPVQLPKFPAFIARDFSENSQVLQAFTDICDKTIKDVKTQALGKIDPNIFNRMFRINITKNVDVYAQDLSENAEHVSQELAKKGVSLKNYKQNIEKAKAIALAFFAKNGHPLFAYSSKEKEIEDQVAEMRVSSLAFCLDHLKMEKSPSPLAFTAKDFQTFNISAKDTFANPKALSCWAHALLQAGEVRARDHIFRTIPTGEISANFFSYLEKWGWASVDTPREGDLVVYLSNSIEPAHAGILRAGGLVSSKPGFLLDHFYIHGLDDLCSLFGNKVVFFRKEASILKVEAELNVLADELMQETGLPKLVGELMRTSNTAQIADNSSLERKNVTETT